MGKGDRLRPVDREAYEQGFDQVFGRCQTHHPLIDLENCPVCRRIWREIQLRQETISDPK